MGIMRLAVGINSEIFIISKVPVPANMTNIPISMKALPRIVNIKNFIAEYSFLPVPQIDIRKNIGINSSSQKRKKSRKSIEVNTPTTAPCRASNHMKCSLVLSDTFHEAKIETIPSNPVNKISGALIPSIAKKY